MNQMKALSLVMAILALCAAGCQKPTPTPPPDPTPVVGDMKDTRDNQTYATVQLGAQTWLAHDLNYDTGNSWCYDDDSANCDTYGRLYDWETAKTACPAGWHLASDQEWSVFIKFLDPDADPAETEESLWAGGMMKTPGTTRDGSGLWLYPNVGATNSSRFNAVPGGARFDDGRFDVMGRHALYWTATENDGNKVLFRVLDYGLRSIYRLEEGSWSMTRNMGISVRCLKD
jgi:uncharacterized protein (TIGR02145 family)